VKSGDRYLRAEVLRELGRAEEAIGWYRSIAEGAFGGLAYLAPSELRLGQVYDEKGEFEKAVHHYRRFVRLWEDCDASLEPIRRQVEGRLARIASSGGESLSQSVASRGIESRRSSLRLERDPSLPRPIHRAAGTQRERSERDHAQP
jgi:tetratricopeptide (TPR) repeat protein